MQVTPARVLVLGGSGHVGRAVCGALAAQGARVAFTYCQDASGAQAMREKVANAMCVRLDVRVAGETQRVVEAVATEWGGLDALVHCVAVGTTQPGKYQLIGDIDESGWDAMMAINVRSAFIATRAFVGACAGRGGNAVLVGSIDGAKSVPASVHYGTSKAALVGMARSMSKEIGRHNVRINVVAPGIQEGGISEIIPADLKAEYLKHSGFKRFGRVDETAALVAWFALENTYVTGQTIVADGGL